MVCGNPAVGKTELIDSLVCNFVRGFLKKRNFSSHGHSSGIMDADSSFDYRKTYGIFVQNVNLSGYQVSLLISIVDNSSFVVGIFLMNGGHFVKRTFVHRLGFILYINTFHILSMTQHTPVPISF